MVIGKKFIVVPLAEDGKIAIGFPAVGVRVRILGTEFSQTVMDSTIPHWKLVADTIAAVESMEAAAGSERLLLSKRDAGAPE